MNTWYLFLDIDGTLLHKEKCQECYDLGGNYFLHKITIRLFSEVGRLIPIVLITGRRKSNYLKLLPYLSGHYAILEHGGLIYDNKNDLEWRKKVGLYFYKKDGPLWMFANLLSKEGFYIDKSKREISFRVWHKYPREILSSDDIKKIEHLLPMRLKIIKNKKLIDIIPVSSGKLNAAKLYIKIYGGNIKSTIFIGDDIEDEPLLSSVGMAVTFRDAPSSVLSVIDNRKENGVVLSPSHKGIIDALNIIKSFIIKV